jgi:hypothetical protein
MSACPLLKVYKGRISKTLPDEAPDNANMVAIKTVLITGSTDVNALGFTAAFLLASQHDYNVILTGRREDAAASACSTLQSRLEKASSKSKVRAIKGKHFKQCIHPSTGRFSTSPWT